MAYIYKGTGYSADAITTDTGRKVYLFRSGGYLGWCGDFFVSDTGWAMPNSISCGCVGVDEGVLCEILWEALG